MHGLILFAHGARDPRWAVPLQQIAARIQARRPGLALRLAFLELQAPDLAAAAAELVQMGCRRVELLPAFLGVGSHLRQELPRLLQALRQQHPGVQLRAHAALGEVGAVQQAIAEHALALLDAGESR
ncbi:MAG TPA: CbiX/SirB N-terminal domain-containing protein [Rubrivivax sp.]|nr:CbiX/SirB N-terminal domain-containing protein [Burkholderiales bacterium]HNT40579.1 CbiX/SirB N-terminal domain-containing protein [Rubrivivax sp.]